MAASYPIRTVSRLTGISLDLLRAWERRYAAISPARSQRGRLYSDEDVARLFLLRNLVDRGYAIGQIASLSDSKLREMADQAAETAVEQAASLGEAAPGLIGPLAEALDNYDFGAASGETWRLAGLLPRREFVHQVALPLMRVVGERWHRNSMSVAQEHMASALMRNALGSLLREQQPSKDAPQVVIAAPSAELHEFGILAAAVLVSAHGLAAVYLGPNAPAEDIVNTARKTRAELVILGVLDDTPDGAPLHGLRLAAEEMPETVQIWAGGPSRQRPAQVPRRVVWLPDLESLEPKLRRFRG